MPRTTTREKVEVVDLTPELAKELFARNQHNRNISERIIAKYCRDMESGAWKFNGDAIRIGVSGNILDGQHRLLAVMSSGVTIRQVLVWDLPDDTQVTMDTGKPRSFSDHLRLKGETDSAGLSALVKLACNWMAGEVRAQWKGQPRSFAELETTLQEHPDLRDALSYGRAMSVAVPCARTIASLAFWLFARIDAEDALDFFEKVRSGANLANDDPILVLRKTLQHHNRGKSRMHTGYQLAYIIKAWNAYRDGRPLQLLRFKPGGANPEAFPEPK